MHTPATAALDLPASAAAALDLPASAAAAPDLPASAASLDLCASAATYGGRPEYVRQARADARNLLAGCPAADEVILCLSELAANAVLHSNSRRPGGTFTVRIGSRRGAYIRLEVEDGGGPWLAPAPDPSSGRGLDIIGALAAEWGVTTGPAGRTVWARFDWPSP